jgi:hypothetical protein
MTPTDTFRSGSFEAWRSAVAFWSQMAVAPSRVAQAQARLTLRMMQAASAWPVPRPVAPVPAGGAADVITATPADAAAVMPADVAAPHEAAALDGVPHGALAEASALAVAAAPAGDVKAAPTHEMAEVLPEEVAVPPQLAMVAALADPAPASAVLAEPEAADLVQAAVEPLLEAAEAATADRPRKPRKG